MNELECKKLAEQLKIYDSATLETAFNRETVVYAAILKSEVCNMVYTNLKRYETYLNG